MASNHQLWVLSATASDFLPLVKHADEDSPKATGSPPDLAVDLVSSLPPEVLTIIFKMLGVRYMEKVALVCRNWRNVAQSAAVWRDTPVYMTLTDSELTVYRVACYQSCTISYNRDIGELMVTLPFRLHAMPHILHLDMTFCSTMSDQAVHQICTTFTQLVSLKLLCFYQDRMTRSSISSICAGLKKLESLTLWLMTDSIDYDLQQLAYSDLPLRHLDLNGCSLMMGAFLRDLSVGKPGLERLTLNGISGGEAARVACIESVPAFNKLLYFKMAASGSESENQFKMIANMKSLRTLDLSSDSTYDSTILKIVAGGSSPIEKLVLKSCINITDASLEVLAGMPHLRQLDISRCDSLTMEGLERLMRRNGNLISLDISCCIGMGSGTLKCIVASQPNLQRLFLNEWHVGDVQLKVASQTLRHLTLLSVDPFLDLDSCIELNQNFSPDRIP